MLQNIDSMKQWISQSNVKIKKKKIKNKYALKSTRVIYELDRLWIEIELSSSVRELAIAHARFSGRCSDTTRAQ